MSNVDVSAIDPHLSDASDSDDLPAPHLPEKFRPDPNDMLLMPNYEPDKRGTRSKDAASSPRPSKAAPASPGALSRFLQSLVEPVPGDRAASLYVGSLCLVQALWILSGIMVTSYLPLYLKDSLQLSMGRIGQLESFSMLAQASVVDVSDANLYLTTGSNETGYIRSSVSRPRDPVLG